MNLTKDDLHSISNKINSQLKDFFKHESFEYKKAYTNIFLPIQKFNEINLFPLINTIRSAGGKVCVNKSDFINHEMTGYLFEDMNQITTNNYGIPEPTFGKVVDTPEIDFVVVPLLAFNSKGYRVGYGKGFYDKFLSQCNKKCIFIGVNHFGETTEFTNIAPHDIPLHFVITPEKIYEI